MKVIKKDGTHEGYDFMKIRNAVTKSAKRVMIDLDDEAFDRLKDIVELRLSLLNTELIPIADMHNVVEESLEQFDPRIAKSYKDYRNYKNGHVVTTADEQLIMDTADKKTARKLWRWNLNGLGYSKTGYNGTYDTAITMDGPVSYTHLRAHET